VRGPYEPSAGHRFNANKLLLDPYANRSSAESSGNSGTTFSNPRIVVG
jgi:glycogen operon protein